MKGRRVFIALVGAAFFGVPHLSNGQPTKARFTVGYLSPFSASALSSQRLLDAFRGGLHERGYDEGSNLEIEARFAEEHYERLATLAKELIDGKVDALFAVTTPAAVAAHRATATVPIVFTLVSDPVRTGLAASLAHPGGNATGTTDITTDLMAKRLALLKEAIPRLTQVGVLGNPDNPTTAITVGNLEEAAAHLGLHVQEADMRSVSDLDAAFAALTKSNVGALVMVADASLTENMPAIIRTAVLHRIPVMGWSRSWAEGGASFAYGTDAFELQRRAAGMVAKILNGARAGDIPVEQPTKFEFVVNLNTSKALGLTIPPSTLLRADQVIQ
jgi:putative ABC transport system substrate-binding protein